MKTKLDWIEVQKYYDEGHYEYETYKTKRMTRYHVLPNGNLGPTMYDYWWHFKKCKKCDILDEDEEII